MTLVELEDGMMHAFEFNRFMPRVLIINLLDFALHGIDKAKLKHKESSRIPEGVLLWLS